MSAYNSSLPISRNNYLDYNHFQSVNESKLVHSSLSTDEDHLGAVFFMIIVLMWYSTSVVFMLGIRIRAHTDTVDDCAQRRAKLFIRTLRDQTQTKQILEELADQQKRDKLWNIYLDRTHHKTDKLKYAEIVRIRNIEKQLAAINRSHIMMNDKLISPLVTHRQSSNSRSMIFKKASSIGNHKYMRRRSSYDGQIIERWKSAVNHDTTQDQVPWAIRKALIRRYFQRYCHKPSRTFERINLSSVNNTSLNRSYLETMGDERSSLLLSKKYMNDNSCPVRSKENDALNLLITNDALMNNEDDQVNIESNLPLITIEGNHHIIEMNFDTC